MDFLKVASIICSKLASAQAKSSMKNPKFKKI